MVLWHAVTVSTYRPRLADQALAELLADLPAVLLTGPRATGKTTTAERIARTVMRLDREAERAVVAADPDAALRGRPAPILVDEWQLVPSILGAIKRAVDEDPAPGRFLVTGSVRSDGDSALWPGTGRLIRLELGGLSVRERRGRAAGPAFLDGLIEGGIDGVPQPDDPPDLRGYVDELLVPGFPQPALHLPAQRRGLWLESYLEQIVTRDAHQADAGRDPIKLARYLEALAIHTAVVVNDATLFQAAGIDRRTALAYDVLLSRLGIIDSLPAWWTNRLKRLVQRPKRLFADSSLAAAATRIDGDGILRDGTVLGRLLETFVIAQLRSELPITRCRPRLHHLRTEQGRHEVDLIVELPGQSIVAIEVKATVAPRRRDAVHLQWLQERLADKFVLGVLFHTGPRAFALCDGVAAIPIASLWSAPPTP